jgi:hypothetical protein
MDIFVSFHKSLVAAFNVLLELMMKKHPSSLEYEYGLGPTGIFIFDCEINI